MQALLGCLIVLTWRRGGAPGHVAVPKRSPLILASRCIDILFPCKKTGPWFLSFDSQKLVIYLLLLPLGTLFTSH